MRILHIETGRVWRGGERQALWLAAELARREHVSVVAARAGEPLAQRVPAQGIELLPCAPAFEADPRGVLALRRYLRARSIEVVHAHTAHAAGLGALATLGMDVPLVVARRVDFRLRRNVGTRWKYGRAAAVIAVSRAVAEVLAQGGVARDKIVVVPDRADADEIIAAADVAVLSSREEGLGSVLLDALLLGKPVAATRAGGIPDVVEHGVTGLLAPVSDPQALGDHIAALLTDRALGGRLGAAARSRVADFSVERMTDRTLAVYERVLARNSPDGRDDTKRRTDAATRTRSASSTRAS